MYAYVVKGSEDGNIGVFRSKKRAIEAAKEYLMNAAELEGEYTTEEFCGGDFISITADWSWVTADIEKFTYA